MKEQKKRFAKQFRPLIFNDSTLVVPCGICLQQTFAIHCYFGWRFDDNKRDQMKLRKCSYEHTHAHLHITKSKVIEKAIETNNIVENRD